jgi:hypothetical protein
MSMDLFGEEITKPTIAESSMRSVLNASWGFQEFWKAWPSNDRKVGKQQSLNKWAKLSCCESATLIIQHVEYLKTTQAWQQGFIPMPCTYLNRQSWIDWEPPKAKTTADAWKRDYEEHKKKAVPMPEYLKRRNPC